MPQKQLFWLVAFACIAPGQALLAESAASYDLSARLEPGDAASVSVTLTVGGELLTHDNKGESVKLPMSAVARLAYREQLVAWSPEVDSCRRSVRAYDTAEVTVKIKEEGVQRSLPENQRTIVAAAQNGQFALNGVESSLSRDSRDLVRVVGDTLNIDQLLPNQEIKQGESWDHDEAAIGALLAMDNVAMCDVKSQIVGMESNQVQIRLSGVVHGSIDGSATEAELRAAYLYHLEYGRISKFNLAIKENRKVGEVAPGLDVVAKLALTAKPLPPTEQPFSDEQLEHAASASWEQMREMVVDSPNSGFRLRHDDSWYVTGEQPKLLSLRLLDGVEMLAHCNVATLPARTADSAATLAELESDVRRSLGDRLADVSAAREWETAAGHRCLGVFANGAVEDIPMQWRYYLITEPERPQISVAVTIEKARIEQFADADRLIIDSLELIDGPVEQASKSGPNVK